MAITIPQILGLAFESLKDTNATIAFEKTIPADVVGVERDLRVAEFAFPTLLALIRAVLAAA